MVMFGLSTWYLLSVNPVLKALLWHFLWKTWKFFPVPLIFLRYQGLVLSLGHCYALSDGPRPVARESVLFPERI